MDYSKQSLQEYLQWDVATFSRALLFWHDVLEQRGGCAGLRALEVGARDGGLSLWLAQMGCSVICSDLDGPSAAARELHARYGLLGAIEYQAIDATDIDSPDGCYDIVLCKSVLGGIGMAGGMLAIDRAVGELSRVLKPGGIMLFAENQQGSRLHQAARRRFRSWGDQWHYLSLDELTALLARFSSSELKSYGLFACFAKDFAPFTALDRLACRAELSPRHYMAYGYAVK